MIIGIDEVGRGAWAGPLVVGAVALGGQKISGLDDSKKLSRCQRVILDKEIRSKAVALGLGWVSANMIDRVGLSVALRLATIKALENIAIDKSDEIIIDGTVNFLTGTEHEGLVTTIKQADSLVPSVSAASIIAKVARDNFMIKQSGVYDGYDLANNVGYGTSRHRLAIEQFGLLPLHRRSFRPISLIGNTVETSPSTKIGNTTGRMAESRAAQYLEDLGHVIIARNWRSRYYEVDLITSFGGTIYFVEVKYRRTNLWGDGLDYIDNKKLAKLKLAAESFQQANPSHQSKMAILAISLVGDSFTIDRTVEIC